VNDEVLARPQLCKCLDARFCSVKRLCSFNEMRASVAQLEDAKGQTQPGSERETSTKGGSGVIIASIWRVGSRCANYKRRRQLPGKAYLPTVCTPACPSCCDPALPTQITSHRTESTGSSSTSSTSCPHLSLKLPRNLNPSCDLSTMRHGSIV